MKRRDFVKLGALAPVAPALLAAQQPAQSDSQRKSVVLGAWDSSLRFVDVEVQTKFIKACFGRHRGIWCFVGRYWPNEEYHIIHNVRTESQGTIIDAKHHRFYVSVGSEITLDENRIHTGYYDGKYPDWTWTPETYEETVIREAAKLGAFNPEDLVVIAIDQGIEQKDIASWMRKYKYAHSGMLFDTLFNTL